MNPLVTVSTKYVIRYVDSQMLHPRSDPPKLSENRGPVDGMMLWYLKAHLLSHGKNNRGCLACLKRQNIHMCIHVYMCVYTYIYIYMCVCVCVCVLYVYMCVCVCEC